VEDAALVDDQARRIARNQLLFRKVNEQARGVNTSFGMPEDELYIVCECGDRGCLQHIRLFRSEYEQLRQDPRHFAVAAGHVVRGVESVILRKQRYWVVRKSEPGVLEASYR
jgi:hypothetical protein